MVEVLKTLLEQSAREGESVVLLGDSSGGNMVVGLAVELLRQRGQVLGEESQSPPTRALKALMLICPSADLRHESAEEAQLERRKFDPILLISEEKRTSVQWAGNWGVGDPRVSPLLLEDELLGLFRENGVEVNGVTAGHDILSPDAVKLRNRFNKLGIKGQWLHWERQMHGFPLAARYGLKESKEGVEWIVGVLNGVQDA